MRTRPDTPDARAAMLASRQHGVISIRQLVGVGVTKRAIERRVERGWLYPIHRGVYSVGNPVVSQMGRWMGAVLAGGQHAVLAGRSAGAHWEFARNDPLLVHVLVPRGMHNRPGLRFHRSSLGRRESTVHRGIPVTSPMRTALDLAQTCGEHELQRAIHEGEVRGLFRPAGLALAMTDHPGTRGCTLLRKIVELGNGRALPTRSEFEDRFIRFLRARDIELPETNVPIRTGRGGFEVDCLWRRAGVVVELDGARFHGTSIAKERDSRKDRALVATGLAVQHITWHGLDDEDEVAADVNAAIAAGLRLRS